MKKKKGAQDTKPNADKTLAQTRDRLAKLQKRADRVRRSRNRARGASGVGGLSAALTLLSDAIGRVRRRRARLLRRNAASHAMARGERYDHPLAARYDAGA
ncbi:MAG: hypothetical protein K8T90_05190 [Planctomycetes bacterium]|nr:hypothetical protein [Planctomycetota bacterium]